MLRCRTVRSCSSRPGAPFVAQATRDDIAARIVLPDSRPGRVRSAKHIVGLPLGRDRTALGRGSRARPVRPATRQASPVSAMPKAPLAESRQTGEGQTVAGVRLRTPVRSLRRRKIQPLAKPRSACRRCACCSGATDVRLASNRAPGPYAAHIADVTGLPCPFPLPKEALRVGGPCFDRMRAGNTAGMRLCRCLRSMHRRWSPRDRHQRRARRARSQMGMWH
jgi:hypothetical protein